MHLTLFWIAQGIGTIGLACTAIAFLSRSRLRLLVLQQIGSVFFLAHFLLLATQIGATMNSVIILRNFVYERKNKAWASHALWPYLFAILSAVFLLVTWQGAMGLFPVMGVSIASFGLWRDKTATIRRFLLVSTLLWIPYLVSVHSYPGIINQLVILASIIFGIAHMDHKSS